jgi:hypothetical protein
LLPDPRKHGSVRDIRIAKAAWVKPGRFFYEHAKLTEYSALPEHGWQRKKQLGSVRNESDDFDSVDGLTPMGSFNMNDIRQSKQF